MKKSTSPLATKIPRVRYLVNNHISAEATSSAGNPRYPDHNSDRPACKQWLWTFSVQQRDQSFRPRRGLEDNRAEDNRSTPQREQSTTSCLPGRALRAQLWAVHQPHTGGVRPGIRGQWGTQDHGSTLPVTT